MREVAIHGFQKEEVRMITGFSPKVSQVILDDRVARFLHFAEQDVPQHTILKLDSRGQVVNHLKPLISEFRDLRRESPIQSTEMRSWTLK